MGFKDCIVDNLEKQKISPAKREMILQKYDEAFNLAQSRDMSIAEAEAFAQEDVARFLKNAEESSRNKVQSLIFQEKISREMSNLDPILYPTEEAKVAFILQKASHRGEAVQASTYSFLKDEMQKLAPNFFETKRDNGTILAALEQYHNGDFTGELGPLAQAFKNTFEYQRLRFVNAGGVMGKVDNWLPQTHSKDAMMVVRKEYQSRGLSLEEAHAKMRQEWIDQVSNDFDVFDDAGRALSIEEKSGFLNDTFEDIMTDGLYSQRKRFEAGEDVGLGRGDIDQRRNKRRVLHPKSFEAFRNYNNRFGLGDNGLAEAIFGSVNSMSRDIGILEVMGPRPTSMMRYLDNRMRFDGKSSAKRYWVNQQFRVLKGIPRSGAADSLSWKIISGVQNLMRSAMLGAASLSAVSDTAFIGATARINGMSASGALSKYASRLFSNSNELAEVSKRAGFIANVINGSVLTDTRFAGEMAGSGVTAWLAGLNNKLSGLGRMTEAAKDGISLEFMGTMGDFLHNKKSFSELNADFKAMLAKSGIGEREWDHLLKVDVFDADGSKFLISNELRISDKIDSALANDLANKVDDVVFALRQQATNEATLASRAITSGAIFGDGSAGSLSKMFASSLFMFKTFPITVMMTHLLPAFKRARSGKLDHLGFALVGTTMLGAVAIHLKDISKGKTRKDMDNVGFWTAAFLQGGGLGLFGDFFLGDYSRFGRSPLTELPGPFVGLADDILRATQGNLSKVIDGDEPNWKRDIFTLVKRNTPLNNLWYTRLAMDRLLYDNIERFLDPKFDKKMKKLERKMTKENGQRFWWGPSERPEPMSIVSRE